VTGENYRDYPCRWCSEAADTCVHVTDITTWPRRDYREYMCNRCQTIEQRIYDGMELRGEVETDELARRMRRALRRRGVTVSRRARAC